MFSKPLVLSCALALSSAAAAQTVQQQVAVTTRSNSPIGDTAKTSYHLDAIALKAYPAITLDEALRQHAGFELFRRASSRIANPTSEGVSLRGLGSTAASRTLVLLDGAPLNDPFGGWVHWDEIPLDAINSITLVTGGGSDLYGSSALGGVIDIDPTPVAAPHLNLSVAGGAQDTSNLAALATYRKKGIDMLFSAESLRTAGYIITDPALTGTVDTPANVRSQAYRTEIGRRERVSKRVFLTGNLLNEDHANGTPLQTNATRLWRYLAGYDAPDTKLATGRVRLFASQEGYRQSFSSIATKRNSEFLTRLQRVHTQELGATADSTLHLKHLAAVVGTDVRDIRGEDSETPISKGLSNGLQAVTARQRFLGAFGELLGERGPWSGAVSLRADRASNFDTRQTTATLTTNTQTAPPNRTEVILSPRAGIVRTLGPHVSLHGSGFRAFRAPTMNELYRTGQVGQEITKPNAALLSERATGYEVGSTFTSANANLNATYFWTIINRPISAVLISQTATTIINQRQNLGQIRSRGIEVALQLFPARPISATVGYQFADATVTKFSAQPKLVGNRIPQVPRNSATAQIHGASERLGQLTLAMRVGGTAFDDANNQFPLSSFVSLDLSGSRALSRRVDVFFQMQNLTNQRPQVARTPLLTLGSPVFGEAGLRFHLGKQNTP
jgi:outer membrane receptor protein involved in Fe transport